MFKFALQGNCFILILYYCTDYNVTRDKKFLQSRFFVWFWDFGSSSWNFLTLELGKLGSSISRNMTGFFSFFGLGKLFLKYNKFFRVSVSWNIRKDFCWENIRNFLILELDSSISREYKNFFERGFFLFFELGLNKCAR